MIKIKPNIFIAGIIAAISSVIIVISVLIAGGSAGLDPVFSGNKQTQPFLYELKEDDFQITNDSPDFYISNVSCIFSEDLMECSVDVVNNNIYGVIIDRITYEITDSKGGYTGLANISDSELQTTGKPGTHTVSFSVCQNFDVSADSESYTVMITIVYKELTGRLHSCVANAGRGVLFD